MYLRELRQRRKGKVYRYHQICTSRWVDGKVRSQVIAHLGRLSPDEAERMGCKLLQIAGKEPVLADELQQGQWRYLGGPALVEALWNRAHLDSLFAALPTRHRELDLAFVLNIATMAQLLAPGSELGKSRWQRRVWNHGRPCCIAYHHFLRALEPLVTHQQQVEEGLFARAQDLFHQQVDVVFCDLTSSYWEGKGPDDLARRGYSRDKRPDRPQCVLSLSMTRNGFPIGWDVHPGNTVDVSTVQQITDKLKQRFKIGHCIFVGDSGLMSRENLKQLAKLGYDYILGLRAAATKAGRAALEATRGAAPCSESGKVAIWELPDDADGPRYVVLESPGREQKTIQILQRKIQQARPKLEQLRRDVRSGKVKKPETMTLRATRILAAAKATAYIGFEAGKGSFCWFETPRAMQLRQDAGKYVLQSSVKQFSVTEIVAAYQMLNVVEAAFRSLKSNLGLRPIFHRKAQRSRGHIGLCVLALFLRATLSEALRGAGLECTPEQALQMANEVIVAPLQTPKEIIWPKPYIPPTLATLLHSLGAADLAARFQQEANSATHPLVLDQRQAS